MVSEYYDWLYADKDYAREVDVILEIFGGDPERVLDVGCGTGNHAFLLAEKGIKVVGIDPDPGMIWVARSKCISGMDWPRFLCGEIGAAPAREADLIISLFNVVNYIRDMRGLLDFFIGIRQHLGQRGIFVFDCWNGIAAIVDPPHGGEGSSSYTDRMNQQTVVVNRVNVDGQEISFTYTIRLWTPFCLEGLLRVAGFQDVEVSAWMEPDEPPTEEMRRMMFVCGKRGKT